MMGFDYRDQLDRFPLEEEEDEEYYLAGSSSVEEDEKPLMSNKLRIKLKVNPEILHAQDHRIDDNKDDDGALRSSSNDWICRLCRKEFSSGKALGGHMRVHVQQQELPAMATHKKLKSNGGVSPAGGDDVGGCGGGFCRKSRLGELERDGKPTCSLCNKSFPSLKSLFGHMRCHPEREWRGMQPPKGLKAAAAAASSNSTTTPSSTVSSDHGLLVINQLDEPAHEGLQADHDQIDYSCADFGSTTSGLESGCADLLQGLSGWSVKAKRGRKSTFVARFLDGNDEMLISAVHGLMLLATGKDCYRQNQEHQDEDDKEKDINGVHDEIGDEDRLCEYYSPSKKPRMILPEELISSSNKNPRIYESKCTYDKNKFEPDCKQEGVEEEEESKTAKQIVMEADPSSVHSNTLGKKRKRKTVKLKDLETSKQINNPTQATKSYSCSICYKSFPTHQALGGHRSSAHNKVLIRNMGPGLPEDGVLETNQCDQEEYGVGVASHICKICDKAFPSGQALGGHKRCHWQGPVVGEDGGEAPPSSSSSSSPTGQQLVMCCVGQSGSAVTKGAVLGFDLNELPADDTEEGYGNGNGQ